MERITHGGRRGQCYRGAMAEINERVEDWQAAGIVDAETAGRILEFERGRSAPKPAVAAQASGVNEASNRPTVIEAVIYLGIVVIAAGFIFLIAENWSEFESWARVAICAAPLGALLLVGFALGASDQPGLKRGGQLAWFVSVGMVVATLAVLFEEFGNGPGHDTVLVIALVTFAYAVTLWVIAPADLQVTAVAGTLFFVAQAIGDFPDEFSTELVGVLGLVFGFLALALTERGLIGPRQPARVVFALFTVATTYEASFETAIGWESLAFVAAIGLLALGIARNSFSLVVCGIGGTFLALITFVFAHFESELGAPFALIISGALVLFGTLLVVQARSITRMRTRMREGSL